MSVVLRFRLSLPTCGLFGGRGRFLPLLRLAFGCCLLGCSGWFFRGCLPFPLPPFCCVPFAFFALSSYVLLLGVCFGSCFPFRWRLWGCFPRFLCMVSPGCRSFWHWPRLVCLGFLRSLRQCLLLRGGLFLSFPPPFGRCLLRMLALGLALSLSVPFGGFWSVSRTSSSCVLSLLSVVVWCTPLLSRLSLVPCLWLLVALLAHCPCPLSLSFSAAWFLGLRLLRLILLFLLLWVLLFSLWVRVLGRLGFELLGFGRLLPPLLACVASMSSFFRGCLVGVFFRFPSLFSFRDVLFSSPAGFSLGPSVAAGAVVR